MVLLVVDVTNSGGGGLRGLSILNQPSNLAVDPRWGGCEGSPCPPFTLGPLERRQFTLPATITDAGQPIFDVVTVSGDGVTRQAVVRIPTPWNPWPYAFGGAALLAAGVAARRLIWPPTPPPPATPTPPPDWASLITAHGALGAAQEPKVGKLEFAAPAVSVRARMDPGETRFGGPIPVTPPPGGPAAGSSPEGPTPDSPTPESPTPESPTPEGPTPGRTS
jgi:hypothetical protein